MEILIAAVLTAVASVFALFALLAVRRLQRQVEQLTMKVTRLSMEVKSTIQHQAGWTKQ